MKKWISVADQMPKDGQVVLVYLDRKTASGTRFAVGYWSPSWVDRVDGHVYPDQWMPKALRAGEVTHWMPLQGPKLKR